VVTATVGGAAASLRAVRRDPPVVAGSEVLEARTLRLPLIPVPVARPAREALATWVGCTARPRSIPALMRTTARAALPEPQAWRARAT